MEQRLGECSILNHGIIVHVDIHYVPFAYFTVVKEVDSKILAASGDKLIAMGRIEEQSMICLVPVLAGTRLATQSLDQATNYVTYTCTYNCM